MCRAIDTAAAKNSPVLRVYTSVPMRRPLMAVMPVVSTALLVLVIGAAPAWSQAAGAERGQQVFAESKCVACHAIAGKGNNKGALDSVGAKLSAADIREWIVNAPAMAAKAKAERKPPMKAFTQLPPADVDALVAYLQTLKK